MFHVEIFIETRIEMERRKVGQAAEWSRNDQRTIVLQQPPEFLQGKQRIREMLEDFDAHDGVERTVQFRNGGDVAHDIQPALIPRTHLEALGIPPAVIPGEVLGYVVKVGTEFPVFQFSRTGVENARTRTDLFQDLFQPRLSRRFVM